MEEAAEDHHNGQRCQGKQTQMHLERIHLDRGWTLSGKHYYLVNLEKKVSEHEEGFFIENLEPLGRYVTEQFRN